MIFYANVIPYATRKQKQTNAKKKNTLQRIYDLYTE